MCNSTSCADPFHGLDDDDLFSGAPLTADELAAGKRIAEAQVARYSEPCGSCGGSGRWTGYARSGQCFKCKGTGRLTFKQPREKRAQQADYRARKATDKAQQIREQVEAWATANPDDHAWIYAKSGSFEFAAAMAEALTKYGSLTERQHATVTRLRLADAERTAARKAEAEARVANAPTVDASMIHTAFAHAQEKGIKKPKMTLDGFKISMAPAHGMNAGALYVVRKADDQYLGKIKDGRFMGTRECDADTEAQVVRIIADPKGEAIAYGQRTGNCCICNRLLTKHASIDAGIGPICAERFGW
jgi:hypothetical protein